MLVCACDNLRDYSFMHIHNQSKKTLYNSIQMYNVYCIINETKKILHAVFAKLMILSSQLMFICYIHSRGRTLKPHPCYKTIDELFANRFLSAKLNIHAYIHTYVYTYLRTCVYIRIYICI